MENIRPASIDERVIAFMIDHFIVLGIYSTLLMSLIVGNLPISDFNKLLIILGFSAFYAVFKDLPGGRSVGKHRVNLGIRCHFDMERKPHKFKLVIRNLFMIILPIDILAILLSKERRSLGDIATGLQVVKIIQADKFDGTYTKQYLDPRGYPFSITDKRR